jgi:hypothetical protein
MRFTVIWKASALDQLAELWLRSANRNAVAAASHQIDQLLRIDPDTRGFPFFGNYLILVGPLRAIFTVDRMDMKVEVYDVW